MAGRDRDEARAFFAARADVWDARFPDDAAAFAAAVAELAPPAGGRVLDLACGTGRALPILRAAVGPDGIVVGIDYVAQMLAAAAHAGRDGAGHLVLGDALAIPLRDASVDAVLAAGLLPHLDDPTTALREIARVCRPGGRLALFHPIGRAVLAARHGRDLDPDAAAAEHRIVPALAAAGWRCESVDDGPSRYLVLAVRAG